VSAPPRISAVVPTLGRSVWLGLCLEALRRQEGVEIVVVDQADRPLAIPSRLVDRVVRPGRNLGFAGGTNAGIAAAAGDWIATVNDDAVVEAGWAATLAHALATAGAAAAQGTNLDLRNPGRVDGCGLAWNRWWQAVQLGHGGPIPANTGEPREIFGVSATAALYRREALDAVSPNGAVFDPTLVSYYEDAELAGRLRAAGHRALWVPAAQARHAGSASTGAWSRAQSATRFELIYGNRYLAAARLLGRGFRDVLPLLVRRDLRDLAKAGLTLETGRLAGIVAGWRRARRLLPEYEHAGKPVEAYVQSL
jgi:GT2 family glycosyltransferase